MGGRERKTTFEMKTTHEDEEEEEEEDRSLSCNLLFIYVCIRALLSTTLFRLFFGTVRGGGGGGWGSFLLPPTETHREREREESVE